MLDYLIANNGILGSGSGYIVEPIDPCRVPRAPFWPHQESTGSQKKGPKSQVFGVESTKLKAKPEDFSKFFSRIFTGKRILYFFC